MKYELNKLIAGMFYFTLLYWDVIMQYFKKGLRSIGQLKTATVSNSSVIAAILSPLLIVGSPGVVAAELLLQPVLPPIETSDFTPPSPDPAGIVYFPDEDFFLITDSEVNEMDMFKGVNVFKVKRSTGELLETFTTIECSGDGKCTDEMFLADPLSNPVLPASFSDEPTGITFNPANNHCFISDDNPVASIHEVDPGVDGICLTDDDVIQTFEIPASFGSSDPEDVTYGNDEYGNAKLFIIDSSGAQVYITGGANELFGQFDTGILGLYNPEGIVYDARNNSLYIASNNIYEEDDSSVIRYDIIHTTTYGVLLDTFNYDDSDDSMPPIHPAGLALAPTSTETADSLQMSLYLVTRGIDNGDEWVELEGKEEENDGKLYEFKLPATTPENVKPEVSSVTYSDDYLYGEVNDDGLPVGSSLVYTWSKVSGPGDVSFTNAHALETGVSSVTAGTYVIRLTAYDGELYNFADVEITFGSTSGSSGGSTSQIVLLFLTMLLLFRYFRKEKSLQL